MSDASPSILLLIPAYNEESRIAPVLEDYAVYFREHHPERFSLVVVLNGCSDNTLGVVEAASEKFPEIRCVNIPEPIGKGGALIEGLKLAPEADLVGYVDADGATRIADLENLESRLRDVRQSLLQHRFNGDCIAIGSRASPQALYEQDTTVMQRGDNRSLGSKPFRRSLLRRLLMPTEAFGGVGLESEGRA